MGASSRWRISMRRWGGRRFVAPCDGIGDRDSSARWAGLRMTGLGLVDQPGQLEPAPYRLGCVGGAGRGGVKESTLYCRVLDIV